MKRIQALRLAILAWVAVVLSGAMLPLCLGAPPATAQSGAGGFELAYDDGVAYKTVKESQVVCNTCLEYQGVRFGLGGVSLAAISSVRFYAGGPSGVVEVVITDAEREHFLTDPDQPIKVSVSRARWYTVAIPAIKVTGDFWVWIKTPYVELSPYHDIKKDEPRSFVAEEPRLNTIPVQKGDFLIRATVSGEIHVGKEAQYKYHTIQEAVDAADPLLTIVVHPGTYDENVNVYKKLSIVSSDGPSATTVRSAVSNDDVFDITVDGVSVSGFTIRGSGGANAAGVRISDGYECFVANNAISGNYYGIYVTPSSRLNVLLENSITLNTYGIYVHGVENNICGNRMESNAAQSGAGVYLSDSAADNFVRFNSFYSDSGSGRPIQVYAESSFSQGEATHNWWGDATGPFHSSANPAGTGSNVGEWVEFAPWLEAEPVAVATGTSSGPGYALDAQQQATTSVIQTGPGKPTIWVASYSDNPGGELPATSIGKWIDICFSDTAAVEAVDIEVGYDLDDLSGLPESALRLYWWNGLEWELCSDQKVDKRAQQLQVTIKAGGTPSLASLSGTPFAVGGTAESGGGFQWWWIAAAIVGLVVLVVVGRVLLGLLGGRGPSYDYE